MTITMYDLAGIDGRRFSPYCWRTRLAFAHKGVPLETRGVGFLEIMEIDPTQRRTVPTIDVDGKLISDSRAIADWLEDTYPDAPSLFGGQSGRDLTRFFEAWTNTTVHGGVARSVLHDIYEHLSESDKPYFRENREKRFGDTLEAIQEGREQRRAAVATSFQALRLIVKNQQFLGGEQPLYADYVVFGGFQWARSVSDFRLLDEDDPVSAWINRVAALHGGVANSVPVYY